MTQAVRNLGLAVLGWTAVGVVFALPPLAAGGDARALLGSLAQWWSWGLVTPVILAADRRLPFSDKQVTRRLLAHLPLSLVVTAAYVYVVGAVRILLGLTNGMALSNPQVLVGALRGMFLWSWLVYWLIVGAWLAHQYRERYLAGELRMERLERLSTEARLHALRLQLDPHFLFNALNTVSSQLEGNPKLARRMIGHLGDLLRLTLETKDRQEVSLGEELAFLDHYLEIQRARFGDRLKFETHVAEEVRGALVPALIVQPLVENAIRHGIGSRPSGGSVRVCAGAIDDKIAILVQDDGVGLPAGWTAEASHGVGLSVTRQRVAGLYPDGRGHFDVRRRPEGGTEVEIRLPLRMNGQPS